jgi:tetratricopeptide (TPR) repeat protein
LGGVWEKGGGDYLTIQKEGDGDSVKYYGHEHNEKFYGKYYDGKIDIEGGLMGNITYSKENDKLYFGGDEFVKSSYNRLGIRHFEKAMSGHYNKQEQQSLIQKAIKMYTEGLNIPDIKPNDKAEILINRGAAYGFIQNYEQCLQDITEGLKIDPKNKNGYFNRGIAYYSMGQIDNALADYTKYLELHPDNAEVLHESGMILRSKGQNQEAIERLSKAIQLKPDLGLAYLERARAYTQAGNHNAAQQDYQRAEQLGVKKTEFDVKLQGNR